MRTTRTIARTRRTTLRTLESSRTAGASWSTRTTLRTALEDRLTAHRNSGTRASTHRRLRWWRRTRGLWRRCRVYRTRSGLRYDHAAAWRLLAQRYARDRARRSTWRSGLRSFRLSSFFRRSSGFGSVGLRRNRCLHFRRLRRGCRRRFGTKFGNFRWRRHGFNRGRCARGHRRRKHRGLRRRRTLRRDRLRGNHARLRRRRDGNFGGRTRGLSEHSRLLRGRLRGLRFLRHRNRRLRRRARRWRSGLLGEGFEHVTGLRDLREIDLRLELVGVCCTVPARRILGPVLLDILPHEYRFVFFNGAGVRLLLGHADFRQRIENGLALYFQLSCQIVNSNLHSAPKVPPYCLTKPR